MALDRERQLRRILRALVRLSDEDFYGTAEIKMSAGTPTVMTVTHTYNQSADVPMAADQRLTRLLDPSRRYSTEPREVARGDFAAAIKSRERRQNVLARRSSAGSSRRREPRRYLRQSVASQGCFSRGSPVGR